MQRFRKTARRPVRQVSRKARPLHERLDQHLNLPNPGLPDLSGLILYGQG